MSPKNQPSIMTGLILQIFLTRAHCINVVYNALNGRMFSSLSEMSLHISISDSHSVMCVVSLSPSGI